MTVPSYLEIIPVSQVITYLPIFMHIFLFFQVLGTPTEENWPGISMSEELQNYNFPPYPAEPLVKRAPRLDAEGIDLVSKFLLYEARKRVSAKEGMHHSYFASLGPGVNNLLDGKDFCQI